MPSVNLQSRKFIRILFSCLLGATGIVWTGAISATPAYAVCSDQHVNFELRDTFNTAWGNKGVTYVNTSTTLNNLNKWMVRSFFIVHNFRNWVEVGWIAGPLSAYGSLPVVYADWMNRGHFSGVKYYPGYSLNPNTEYRFRVENVGGNRIWRFVVDGESSPFQYSPTMTFNSGFPLDNSEKNNSCDSLYTHMYDLAESINATTWTGYSNLECYDDAGITAWDSSISSNSEYYINGTSADSC